VSPDAIDRRNNTVAPDRWKTCLLSLDTQSSLNWIKEEAIDLFDTRSIPTHLKFKGQNVFRLKR
jgi:hypothetical protein